MESSNTDAFQPSDDDRAVLEHNTHEVVVASRSYWAGRLAEVMELQRPPRERIEAMRKRVADRDASGAVSVEEFRAESAVSEKENP